MLLTRFANVPIDMFVFNCFLPGFAVLALSVLELEQPIMKPSLFSFLLIYVKSYYYFGLVLVDSREVELY